MAHAERRALVTENAGDFLILVQAAAASGSPHHGLIVTSHRAFPRSKGSTGRLVTALEALLTAHPGDDDLVDRGAWLGPPDSPP